MTTEVTIEIISTIKKMSGLHDSLCMDIGNRIVEIVDKKVGEAIMEGCEIGEILRAVGLRITSE